MLKVLVITTRLLSLCAVVDENVDRTYTLGDKIILSVDKSTEIKSIVIWNVVGVNINSTTRESSNSSELFIWALEGKYDIFANKVEMSGEEFKTTTQKITIEILPRGPPDPTPVPPTPVPPTPNVPEDEFENLGQQVYNKLLNSGFSKSDAAIVARVYARSSEGLNTIDVNKFMTVKGAIDHIKNNVSKETSSINSVFKPVWDKYATDRNKISRIFDVMARTFEIYSR